MKKILTHFDISVHKKILLLCVCVGASAILAGIFVIYSLYHHATLEHGESRDIVFSTIPYADLRPHDHEQGDSMNDVGHHVKVYSKPITLSTDTWVTSLTVRIINAPPAVIHHGILLDARIPYASCGNVEPSGRFLHFGQDNIATPALVFPPGYALFIPKGHPIILDVMLHNPLPPIGPGGEYKNVSVELTLHTSATPLIPLTYYDLYYDDIPCKEKNPGGTSTFVVPPHVHNMIFTSAQQIGNPGDLFVTHSGHIMYTGGHLHGWSGGTSVDIIKNGSLLETFMTTRVPNDPYLFMTPHHGVNWRIQKGDVISVQTTYSNTGSRSIPDAMGYVGMWIAWDK